MLFQERAIIAAKILAEQPPTTLEQKKQQTKRVLERANAGKRKQRDKNDE